MFVNNQWITPEKAFKCWAGTFKNEICETFNIIFEVAEFTGIDTMIFEQCNSNYSIRLYYAEEMFIECLIM
jgi:hypothetical protein